MNLPSFFRPLAKEVCTVLANQPEAATIDGLLALGVAFASLSPRLDDDECKRLWCGLGRDVWEGVISENFPRPEGLIRHKRVKPTGGLLTTDGRRVFEAAKEAIVSCVKRWEITPSNADVSVMLLILATRCANPSTVGQREWQEIVARAWDERAMEFETTPAEAA